MAADIGSSSRIAAARAGAATCGPAHPDRCRRVEGLNSLPSGDGIREWELGAELSWQAVLDGGGGRLPAAAIKRVRRLTATAGLYRVRTRDEAVALYAVEEEGW